MFNMLDLRIISSFEGDTTIFVEGFDQRISDKWHLFLAQILD